MTVSSIASLLCDDLESERRNDATNKNSPVSAWTAPEAYGIKNVIDIFCILRDSKELVLAPCKHYLKTISLAPAYLRSFEMNSSGKIVFTVVFKNGARIVKKVMPTEIMLQNTITKHNLQMHNRKGKVVEVSFAPFCIAANLNVRFGCDHKKLILDKRDVAARVFKHNFFYQE